MQIAEQECAVKWQGHTITRALRAVSRATGTPRNLLMHDHCKRARKELRWMVMWLARELGYSYPRIGHHMGGRDHSTILYGIRKARHLRETNEDYRALSDKLLDELRTPPLPPPPLPSPPEVSQETAAQSSGIRASDEVVRFYDVASDDDRYRRSYLVEQNERFCAAMRAAMDEEARS